MEPKQTFPRKLLLIQGWLVASWWFKTLKTLIFTVKWRKQSKIQQTACCLRLVQRLLYITLTIIIICICFPATKASILAEVEVDKIPFLRLSQIYIDLHKIVDGKDTKVLLYSHRIVIVHLTIIVNINISYELSKGSMQSCESILLQQQNYSMKRWLRKCQAKSKNFSLSR